MNSQPKHHDSREREELLATIGDFLESGHVENIAAMFRQEPGLYELAADLIRDERLVVRIGMAVLFEELAATRPGDLQYAVPVLLPLLQDSSPTIRGDAATLLGITATPEALAAVAALRDDPDPQVVEIAADIMADRDQQG